jgi:hypothetical protein
LEGVAQSLKVPTDKFANRDRHLLNTPPMPMSDIPRKRKPKKQDVAVCARAALNIYRTEGRAVDSSVMFRSVSGTDCPSFDGVFGKEPVPVRRSRWFSGVLPEKVG